MHCIGQTKINNTKRFDIYELKMMLENVATRIAVLHRISSKAIVFCTAVKTTHVHLNIKLPPYWIVDSACSWRERSSIVCSGSNPRVVCAHRNSRVQVGVRHELMAACRVSALQQRRERYFRGVRTSDKSTAILRSTDDPPTCSVTKMLRTLTYKSVNQSIYLSQPNIDKYKIIMTTYRKLLYVVTGSRLPKELMLRLYGLPIYPTKYCTAHPKFSICITNSAYQFAL